MINRKGMTLVEIILAIAILALISIAFLTGFSSQLFNINKGTKITVDAMDAVAIFEEGIFEVKSTIQKDSKTPTEPSQLNGIDGWSAKTIEVLGKNIDMHKLYLKYPDNSNKDSTIYLSESLAVSEIREPIKVENVMIEVSDDTNNMIADLASNPSPKLTAIYSDNSSEPGFYVNLFRWYRSLPGKDLAQLNYPDDFMLISVSQTTDVLSNLLDNVGANRYVVLTITPVDIHGFRGNTSISSNVVYIKGQEWRVGAFPWIDKNNDYDYGTGDIELSVQNIIEQLNTSNSNIPNPDNPSVNLDLTKGSLFVPMNVSPSAGLTPGNIPIPVENSSVIDWLVEKNINLAKDIKVNNNSNITLKSGVNGNDGSIYLYQYIELNSSGNPVIQGGIPKTIDLGSSLETGGNILLHTVGKGNIELINFNTLKASNIALEAKGSVMSNNSTFISNGDITIDTTKNLAITGNRDIVLNESNFTSSSPNSKLNLNTRDNILFKGGGWSSNQTIVIPDSATITFKNANSKVNNLGNINLQSTAKIRFSESMIADLAKVMRIRLDRHSKDTFNISTLNYERNIAYANSNVGQRTWVPGVWLNLGSNQHNLEFSTSIVSGPGRVEDISYSFDGNNQLKMKVEQNRETSDTRVKIDMRDKYSNNSIVGTGYYVYSVDNNGNQNIDVEVAPPIDNYKVTFNTFGGTFIPDFYVTSGEQVIKPTDPVKIGYDFIGWNKTLPMTMPQHDLVIDAIWEKSNYFIEFNSNGGTTISPINYEYDKTIDYNALTKPTKTGYVFVKWDSEYDRMPPYNITLNAVWEEETFTAKFMTAEGTIIAERNFKYGDPPISPPAPPIIKDKTFIGWNPSFNLTSMPARDLEFIAVYEDERLPLSVKSISPPGFSRRFSVEFSNEMVSSNKWNGSPFGASSIEYSPPRNVSQGRHEIKATDKNGYTITFYVNLEISFFGYWYNWTIVP